MIIGVLGDWNSFADESACEILMCNERAVIFSYHE